MLDLERFADAIRTDYPTRRLRSRASGTMKFGDEVSATAPSKPTGIVFVSPDEKQVTQAHLDGFTFSRLAPYGNWATFRDEARKWWLAYRELVTPATIVRLAVRYVNRFDIPLPQVELKDYFRTSPEISPDLPQIMDGFFFQVAIAFPEIHSRVLLSETIVPPAAADTTSIVLDIDLYRESDVPDDERNIWDFFEVLHEKKNSIFEACITDAARKVIQ